MKMKEKSEARMNMRSREVRFGGFGAKAELNIVWDSPITGYFCFRNKRLPKMRFHTYLISLGG